MSAKPEKKPEAAEGEAPKKGKGKLIVIIAIVVALLAGGGGAAWYFLSPKDDAKKEKSHKTDKHGDAEAGDEADAGGDEEDEEEEDDEEHHPVYEKLETFTVNLAGGGESYLQVDVSLKMLDPEASEKIKAAMPDVQDAVLQLLSAKTAEELATPEGKKALAEDIKKAVNKAIHVKKSKKGVTEVKFTSFIIQ
jgi:flagellar FliL protein